MLSLKKKANSKPIAVIKNPPNKDEYVYLNYNEENYGSLNDYDEKINLLSEDFFKKFNNLDEDEIFKLKKSIENNEEPNNNKLSKIYNLAMEEITKKLKNEIKISKGKLIPLLKKDFFNRFYVSGKSGSGKSTIVSKILENSKKIINKKGEIIL